MSPSHKLLSLKGFTSHPLISQTTVLKACSFTYQLYNPGQITQPKTQKYHHYNGNNNRIYLQKFLLPIKHLTGI